MQNFYPKLNRYRKLTRSSWVMLLAAWLLALPGRAQQDGLECYQRNNWVSPKFGDLSTAATWDGYTGTNVSNHSNLLSADPAQFATITLVSSRACIIGGSIASTKAAWGSITVTDLENTDYQRGNYVAFVTSSPYSAGTILKLDDIKIELLNAGSVVASTTSPVISEIGGGLYEIGMNTTGSGTYDAISLTVGVDSPIVPCQTSTTTLNVYNVVQVPYCNFSKFPCNTNVSLSQPIFKSSGLTATGSGYLTGVTNEADLVSPSTEDYATMGGLLPRWVKVKDEINTYGQGTFVGFEIENNTVLELSLFGDMKIKTMNNGSVVESSNVNNLLVSGQLLSFSGRKVIGFVTTSTSTFNEVWIGVDGLDINLGSTRIYRAVIKKFCEGPAFPCNDLTYLKNPTYPVTSNGGIAGLINVSVGTASVSNLGNLVDSDSTNYTLITGTLSVGDNVGMSVKKEGDKIAAGSFIGFDVESVGGLGLDLIKNLEVLTFKDGAQVESQSGAGLLSLKSSLLTGSDRQVAGFITTEEFDEVRLNLFTTVGIDLGSTRIYGAVVRSFCPTETEPDCNTLTVIRNPENPVYVNSQRTGTGETCLLCAINDVESIIDNDPETYARITTVASLLSTAQISVANALETYPARSFVGFEIASEALLNLTVLDALTIRLYKDGEQVQNTGGLGALLSANTSLLAEGLYNRHMVGIIAEHEFDEVQITFVKPVDVNLGEIRIYSLVVSPSCEIPIACNSSYYLTQSAFPVYINPSRTGVAGILDALGEVRDAWNVVSPSTSDYAIIGANVGVAEASRISVVDAVHEYPAGTIAGFTVSTDPSIAELDLLSSLTIITYLDGEQQESSSAFNLINLELLGLPVLGGGSSTYNVGFITTKPFDEIQIAAINVVGLDLLNEIKVYGAYVDTRFSQSGGSVSCVKTNPDINVAYLNATVEGDVSTNDAKGENDVVTYGTPVALPGNPTSAVPTVQPDGSYTFITNQKGVYNFNISYCVAPQTSGCPTERLTVTVLDAVATDNAPVVNTDFAYTTNPNPVTIPVLDNDQPGNQNSSLGIPVIVSGPSSSQGTAVVAGNNIEFTPTDNFYGKVVITYEVCESPSGLCGQAEVIIWVYPAGSNSVIATDDYYRIKAGNTLTITAPGIVDNDVDANVGVLTVSPSSSARLAALYDNQGTITINPDGSFTYVAPGIYQGTDAFVYTVCNAAGVCANATVYIQVWMSTPLPVRLSHFEVANEGNAAHLTWSTTEEVNASHFEVERSFEGKNWHRIGDVKALGNSTIEKAYHFVDAQVANGVNYYRLKIVDRDGSSEYSDVRSLTVALAEAEVTVAPNPVVDKIQLKIRDLKNVEKVELLSASGRVIYQTTSDFTAAISMRHLPAGLYLVTITQTGGRVITHKVIKN